MLELSVLRERLFCYRSSETVCFTKPTLASYDFSFIYFRIFTTTRGKKCSSNDNFIYSKATVGSWSTIINLFSCKQLTNNFYPSGLSKRGTWRWKRSVVIWSNNFCDIYFFDSWSVLWESSLRYSYMLMTDLEYIVIGKKETWVRPACCPRWQNQWG